MAHRAPAQLYKVLAVIALQRLEKLASRSIVRKKTERYRRSRSRSSPDLRRSGSTSAPAAGTQNTLIIAALLAELCFTATFGPLCHVTRISKLSQIRPCLQISHRASTMVSEASLSPATLRASSLVRDRSLASCAACVPQVAPAHAQYVSWLASQSQRSQTELPSVSDAR